MKMIGTVLATVICLAAGFAAGYKTALVREHSRLERNKQILRRIHKEVWSNPDLKAALKAADELYTPDFVVHDSTGDYYGLASRKKDIADARSAYPDYNEEVLDMVAEGDVVVTRRGSDLSEVGFGQAGGADDMGDARLSGERRHLDARRRGGEIDHAVGLERRRQRVVADQDSTRADAGEQPGVRPQRRRAVPLDRRGERHAWRLGDRLDQHPSHAPGGAGDDQPHVGHCALLDPSPQAG